MDNRLNEGQKAPDFSAETYNGKARFRLSHFRGKPVWLIFYRYAACPLCNLHFSRLLDRTQDSSSERINIIAIFESKPDQFPKTLGGRPYPEFPILSDPEKKIYELYGTEAKLSAALRPSVAGSWLKAFWEGYPQGSIDGDIGQIPAHFLISEYGVIETAYYGKTIADHLPWKTAEAFIEGKRDGRWTISNALAK